MAAITSAANGNWSATATWTGGVVPGNGDTAMVLHNVTVDVNTIIGASNGQYAAGTIPCAVQVGNNSNATLTVAAGKKLTCRGDFGIYSNLSTPTFTLNAGATFELDSSLTAPTTTAYRIMPLYHFQYGGIAANGTSGARCFLQSNAGGANGYIAMNGFSYGNSLTMTYTTFLRIGSSSISAVDVNWHNALVTVSLSNVLFDTCGVLAESVHPDSVGPSLINVTFQNSLGANNTSFGELGTFTKCVFDLPFGSQNITSATFSGCYFNDAPTPPRNSNFASGFTNNYVRNQQIGNPYNAQCDLSNSIFLIDNAGTNPHFILNNDAIGQTYDGLICEFTDSDGNGDFFSMVNGPTSAKQYTIKNCLVLPNAGNNDAGTLISVTGGFNNGLLDCHHNTYYTGMQGANFGETGENTPGTITFFKNNIAWDRVGSRGHILQDVGHINSSTGVAADIVAPANADYNNGWNLEQTWAPAAAWFTNQGRSYEALWSATPGAHDLSVNPNFVDSTRNSATFDNAYLGHVASATWASEAAGHTFAVGDIISNNNAMYYQGALINFRCILSHTKSTANSEPGNGSSWRTYWELATFQTLRNAITNGSTITDASLGLAGADYITALRTWIRAGFAPTNTALRGAGSDGLDIGAVPVYVPPSSGGSFFSMLGIG